MKSIRYSVLILFLFVLSTGVHAENDFSCVIKYSASLNKSGLLDEDTKGSVARLHEKFKVERATGKITSEYKMLVNLSLEPLTVQDLPGGNSYKVLTSNDRKYLEIKKYVKEPQKPFIYKLGFIIATGLCTYI